MKILRVIGTMDPKSGGPCEGIRNSIPAMKRIGVVNEVLCFDNSDAEFTKNQGFKIHALGPARGPYWYCEGLNLWLFQNLRNYDSVIIHGLWLYNSYGTWRTWRNLKRSGQKVPRLYIMPHGMLDPYFQRSRERRLKAIRNWFFWKLVEEKVVNGADGVLFTCEEEMILARKTFRPYHPKKELNVSYGITPPPEFKNISVLEFQQKCPELNGRPYWLFLSRIHQKKGVSSLIEAYLELKNTHSDIPDLVIAGPGLQSTFGKKILKMAESRSIHFPGMLKGPAKWAAFYQCEAFVLPSHQENFGIAIVEALACAKPVLISNKVNIWREIKNGRAGLVAEDTREGTYWLLKEWLELSEANRLTLSTNARVLFDQNFRIEEAALKMVGCLKPFLQPSSAI
jgi:glycosyltransferase involved in cell wall biosynthesis